MRQSPTLKTRDRRRWLHREQQWDLRQWEAADLTTARGVAAFLFEDYWSAIEVMYDLCDEDGAGEFTRLWPRASLNPKL